MHAGSERSPIPSCWLEHLKHSVQAPAPRTESLEPLHPVAEAHLCQLAAFENYAQHGMFVKFGPEEAVRLEARALDLAVQQSTQDAELIKCVMLMNCSSICKAMS